MTIGAKSSLLILLLIFTVTCAGNVSDESFPKESLQTATNLIRWLSNGESLKALELFDMTAKNDISAEKLAEFWDDLENKNGTFEEIRKLYAGTASDITIVFATCDFERNEVVVQITIEHDGQVSDLDVV